MLEGRHARGQTRRSAPTEYGLAGEMLFFYDEHCAANTPPRRLDVEFERIDLFTQEAQLFSAGSLNSFKIGRH